MDIFEWIEREFTPRQCVANELFYDEVESQSFRCLPIIYEPFDVKDRAHWRDRGSLFDYLHSCGEGRLLDFGPGDGWPSLIVAPYVKEVVGVEGSRRRAEVCTGNAKRLGISNASFVFVPPGELLPFDDGAFDGAMASSSLEQAPDPKASLTEIFRILKPGGRFRLRYEALSGYRQGKERDVWLCELDDDRSMLFLYDRRIDWEQVRHYGVVFDRAWSHMSKVMGVKGRQLAFSEISLPVMKKLHPYITEVRTCDLTHPSGPTWVSWMKEVGFSEVRPTHNGADFAGRLFDNLPRERHPGDIDALDELLRPLMKIIVEMQAPADTDPMITVVK